MPVRGKGRRERALPLWKQTAEDLRAWFAVRGDLAVPELFLSAHGRAMTRVGFTHVLRKYVGLARTPVPPWEGNTSPRMSCGTPVR